MTSTAERRDQVGAFFAAHADRLRRAVRRRAAGVSDAIIDDACQIAWATLLRRPDITLDRSGLGWLTTDIRRTLGPISGLLSHSVLSGAPARSPGLPVLDFAGDDAGVEVVELAVSLR